MKDNLNQRGSALFLSIILLSIILAIALGLSAIVTIQVRTLRGTGDSVVAFYAADAGIEKMLKDITSETIANPPNYSGILENNKASYQGFIYCCDMTVPDSKCTISSCALDTGIKDGCKAPRYCIQSTGSYHNTERAIEVEI